MKVISIFFCALLCPLGACAGGSPGGAARREPESRGAAPREHVYVESSINDDRESLWNWHPTRIKNEDGFDSIQLLSATNAFVLGSQGTLYKTTDGGESWGQIDISTRPEGDVTSFHFINPSFGWVSITRTSPDTNDPEGFESWILNTRDGGLTWQTQYSGKGLELERVLFVNEQEGWVTGSRAIKNETLQNDYFVIHTADQGNHWRDVSNGLNPDTAGGHVTDIYSTEPSKAVLLTSSRKIFATITGGESWQLVGSIPKLPAQTMMIRLGMREDGRPWVLGGAAGREGTRMVLALKDDENSWTIHKTNNVFLSDAAFLSDVELIACGSIATDDNPRVEGGSEGVILYSADKGRRWSTVYRNARVKTINALAAVNPDNVWAVGSDGLILRLGSRTARVAQPYR